MEHGRPGTEDHESVLEIHVPGTELTAEKIVELAVDNDGIELFLRPGHEHSSDAVSVVEVGFADTGSGPLSVLTAMSSACAIPRSSAMICVGPFSRVELLPHAWTEE